MTRPKAIVLTILLSGLVISSFAAIDALSALNDQARAETATESISQISVWSNISSAQQDQMLAKVFLVIGFLSVATGCIFLLHLGDTVLETKIFRSHAKLAYAVCFGGLSIGLALAAYLVSPQADAARKAFGSLAEWNVTSTTTPDVQISEPPDKPCWKSPSCWANEHLSVAENACQELIKSQLQASGWDQIRWTNGWFTSIFQAYSVSEPQSDHPVARPYIRYRGNSISGSDRNSQTRQVEYICTYDPVVRLVLNVYLRTGSP